MVIFSFSVCRIQFRRSQKFKGLWEADILIIVGKIEITVHSPVRTPAVSDNPRTVFRRFMICKEIVFGKMIIPADNCHCMINVLYFIGILRPDGIVFAGKIQISIHLHIRNILYPISEIIRIKKKLQLIGIQ